MDMRKACREKGYFINNVRKFPIRLPIITLFLVHPFYTQTGFSDGQMTGESFITTALQLIARLRK